GTRRRGGSAGGRTTPTSATFTTWPSRRTVTRWRRQCIPAWGLFSRSTPASGCGRWADTPVACGVSATRRRTARWPCRRGSGAGGAVAWRVASGGEEGLVLIRDPRTGEELRRLECGPNHVAGLAFSPCGRLLATAVMGSTYTGPDGVPGGAGDGILLWELETGRQLAKLATPAPHCLAFEHLSSWRLASGAR